METESTNNVEPDNTDLLSASVAGIPLIITLSIFLCIVCVAITCSLWWYFKHRQRETQKLERKTQKLERKNKYLEQQLSNANSVLKQIVIETRDNIFDIYKARIQMPAYNGGSDDRTQSELQYRKHIMHWYDKAVKQHLSFCVENCKQVMSMTTHKNTNDHSVVELGRTMNMKPIKTFEQQNDAGETMGILNNENVTEFICNKCAVQTGLDSIFRFEHCDQNYCIPCMHNAISHSGIHTSKRVKWKCSNKCKHLLTENEMEYITQKMNKTQLNTPRLPNSSKDRGMHMDTEISTHTTNSEERIRNIYHNVYKPTKGKSSTDRQRKKRTHTINSEDRHMYEEVIITKSKSIPNVGPLPDSEIDDMLEDLGWEFEDKYKQIMYINDIETYQDLIDFDQDALRELIKNEHHFTHIVNKAIELYVRQEN